MAIKVERKYDAQGNEVFASANTKSVHDANGHDLEYRLSPIKFSAIVEVPAESITHAGTVLAGQLVYNILNNMFLWKVGETDYYDAFSQEPLVGNAPVIGNMYVDESYNSWIGIKNGLVPIYDIHSQKGFLVSKPNDVNIDTENAVFSIKNECYLSVGGEKITIKPQNLKLLSGESSYVLYFNKLSKKIDYTLIQNYNIGINNIVICWLYLSQSLVYVGEGLKYYMINGISNNLTENRIGHIVAEPNTFHFNTKTNVLEVLKSCYCVVNGVKCEVRAINTDPIQDNRLYVLYYDHLNKKIDFSSTNKYGINGAIFGMIYTDSKNALIDGLPGVINDGEKDILSNRVIYGNSTVSGTLDALLWQQFISPESLTFGYALDSENKLVKSEGWSVSEYINTNGAKELTIYAGEVYNIGVNPPTLVFVDENDSLLDYYSLQNIERTVPIPQNCKKFRTSINNAYFDGAFFKLDNGDRIQIIQKFIPNQNGLIVSDNGININKESKQIEFKNCKIIANGIKIKIPNQKLDFPEVVWNNLCVLYYEVDNGLMDYTTIYSFNTGTRTIAVGSIKVNGYKGKVETSGLGGILVNGKIQEIDKPSLINNDKYFYLDSVTQNEYKLSSDIKGGSVDDTTVLVHSKCDVIYSIYDKLVSDYPGLITKKELGIVSSERLPLNMYIIDQKTIQNNSKYGLGKFKIFIQASIHGYEQGAAWSLAQFIDNMLREVDGINKDFFDFVKNNITMVIIPVANPWGFGHNKRQNENQVDLNRNFNVNWAKSGNPGDEYYSGPSAASEEETKILQKAIEDNQDSVWYIDYHNIANGNPLFFVNSKEQVGLCNALFTKLTKTWIGEYSIKPSEVMGYCNTDLGASASIYPLKYGIKSFTLETPWTMPLVGKKQYDLNTIKTAVQVIGNMILAILKSSR